MILHDFIYEWDGKSSSGEKPIAWWPGSYRVRIVKLKMENTGLSYLIHFAVILKNASTPATMNISLRNSIHNFAQKISKQYDLNIDKTLWIELDGEIRVAMLNPERQLASETLYSVSWRPIRPNELKIIEPYITDI
ncbi:MAG: hypothetical protein KOO64_10895 [Desulfobacterales bacterium]|nr:hypothetical protein [Desulfobacterales bacterium]